MLHLIALERSRPHELSVRCGSAELAATITFQMITSATNIFHGKRSSRHPDKAACK